ncbi:hypothetical protein VTJ83DRAFT_2251 [Remersonia thermophila]|uniref:Uncharacterized protein n=1 Tax=Remersonia thermophila TaxID=72144 RepID=A0ABR4DI78_9PEZI
MAPTAAFSILHRRYEDCRKDVGFLDDDDDDECYGSFWSSKEGMIIKWSLFLGFIVACLLYLLIGYIHAHHRIKKGLPPLSYHRFLISRDVLARVDPLYAPPPPRPYGRPASSASASNVYYPWAPGPQYVDMYAMPPPMYDPNAPRPPKYEPPAPAPARPRSLRPPLPLPLPQRPLRTAQSRSRAARQVRLGVSRLLGALRISKGRRLVSSNGSF